MHKYRYFKIVESEDSFYTRVRNKIKFGESADSGLVFQDYINGEWLYSDLQYDTICEFKSFNDFCMLIELSEEEVFIELALQELIE